MQLYETAIVFDSQSKSEEIEDRIKNVNSFITNHGGEIVDTTDLGKKRLAYEINKKQYGYYVFIRFTGPGQLIALLEREYRLSENVLRYLTLKVDKNQISAEEKAAKMNEEAAKAESEPTPAAPVEAKKESTEPVAAEVAPTEEKPAEEPQAEVEVTDTATEPEVEAVEEAAEEVVQPAAELPVEDQEAESTEEKK